MIKRLTIENGLEDALNCTKNEVFHYGFFSVSITKSAVSCGFGHIYLRNP